MAPPRVQMQTIMSLNHHDNPWSKPVIYGPKSAHAEDFAIRFSTIYPLGEKNNNLN